MNAGVQMKSIVVSHAQCQALAQRLAEVRVRPDEFVVRPTGREDKRREANLHFYLIAICQSTRTLQGTLDGKWYRGWDYMVRAARRMLSQDPDYFSAFSFLTTAPHSAPAGCGVRILGWFLLLLPLVIAVALAIMSPA